MVYRFCAMLLFGGLGFLLAECLIFGIIEECAKRGKARK